LRKGLGHHLLQAIASAKAGAIAAEIKKSTVNEYTQVIKAYEYLQENTKYDHQELLNVTKGKAARPNAHNAYGALVEGLAVCSGLSEAFALLAQKLGFECMIVSGRSLHRTIGISEHAWNIIKVKNRHYHMDVTWDTNQYAEIKTHSYDYFALDDEEISRDHDWDISTTPACSFNDLSYYFKSSLYANTKDHLTDILRAGSKNRHKPVRVKLSFNISLPQEAGGYIAEILLNEAVKTGASAQVTYSWNEHTRCFFAKFK